jgi:hypothetical protein
MSEPLNWTQVGPDGTVRLIVGDEERGQIEVVFKFIIQSVVLNGHDVASGLPQLQTQVSTLSRFIKVDPKWRAQPKLPEGSGYR